MWVAGDDVVAAKERVGVLDKRYCFCPVAGYSSDPVSEHQCMGFLAGSRYVQLLGHIYFAHYSLRSLARRVAVRKLAVCRKPGASHGEQTPHTQFVCKKGARTSAVQGLARHIAIADIAVLRGSVGRDGVAEVVGLVDLVGPGYSMPDWVDGRASSDRMPS